MGFFERSLTLGMCGLLVMVGLWYGLQGVYHWARSRAAQRWPTVPGRVTAAGLDVHASAGTYGTVARAAVEYEYRVDGKRHIGRMISFGRLYHEQLGEDIPLPYPVGAAVTV